MSRASLKIEDLRRMIKEEMATIHEQVDHAAIRDIVNDAQKLLSAVETFKQSAPASAINAVTPHIDKLEQVLEDMLNTPASYVTKPKVEPKKVSLRPVKQEGRIRARSRFEMYEHGDQCPECGGTIISKHGQFEHLKCRDCGYVPRDDAGSVK